MKVGVCLPYMEPELDRRILLHWMRAIDQGPFNSLTCGERIHSGTLEMTTTLGAAAAVTERVRIVPSLYVLPMHNAVWAAKEIATLDVISNGRVSVTVGVGGRPMDYEVVGASFERRHQRMDEQISVMKSVWRGEPVLAGGDEIGPPPVQDGGPPILAGTMGPKATRRAAEWADGLYMWSGNGQKPEIERMIEQGDAAWEDAGRTEKFGRFAGFWCSLADGAQERTQNYVYEYLKILSPEIGKAMAKAMDRTTPDKINESLDWMEELGVEETYLVPTTCDTADIDRISELIAKRG
ncbi:MAG: LLM class flavin-dependent oxidoreductase [Myxococcota bacterium]|jgi:alkanesulfonate monooxygenase SsuD/methylene tetrahydromethanopterin reductase-like flavin-dependent oxidoreductase (luciferase family)|nr:LLM class flavin-dependent oxidoreductase [Myxococcota bacterium]